MTSREDVPSSSQRPIEEEETQLTTSESGGDGGSNEEPETLSGAADTQGSGSLMGTHESELTLAPDPNSSTPQSFDLGSEARSSLDPVESGGGSGSSLTFTPHTPEQRPQAAPPTPFFSMTPQPQSPTSPVSPAGEEITPGEPSEDQGSSMGMSSRGSEVTVWNGESSRASNPLKRGNIWLNLKQRGGKLRKRLCSCLSPKAREPDDGNGYRVEPSAGSILRSEVEMNSFRASQVERVLNEHGNFIVLKGERLNQYRQRIGAMLTEYFDRRSGYEILRLWRLDAIREARLNVELLPSPSTVRRYLTLSDVRLRDQPYDYSDDSLFRYFMSFEGLRSSMLTPPGRA